MPSRSRKKRPVNPDASKAHEAEGAAESLEAMERKLGELREQVDKARVALASAKSKRINADLTAQLENQLRILEALLELGSGMRDFYELTRRSERTDEESEQLLKRAEEMRERLSRLQR